MDEKAYIVCCGANGRAVIFGHSEHEPEAGKPITLTKARMIVYWSSECGGLFGLAVNGPKKGSRLSETVEKTSVDDVKQWLSVTAVKEIREWPSM